MLYLCERGGGRVITLGVCAPLRDGSRAAALDVERGAIEARVSNISLNKERLDKSPKD